MNKKILLFVVACMILSLATFVKAGDTACGIGGCQAVTVTSTSGTSSVLSINATGTFSRGTTTWSVFCGNASGKKCFNNTNALYTNCTAPNNVWCDPQRTLEYLNQRINASNATTGKPFWNITFVRVGVGSAIGATVAQNKGGDQLITFEVTGLNDDKASTKVVVNDIDNLDQITIDKTSLVIAQPEDGSRPRLTFGAVKQDGTGFVYTGEITANAGLDNIEGVQETGGTSFAAGFNDFESALGGDTEGYLAIVFSVNNIAMGVATKVKGTPSGFPELTDASQPVFAPTPAIPGYAARIAGITTDTGILFDEVDATNQEPLAIVVGSYANPGVEEGSFISEWALDAPTYQAGFNRKVVDTVDKLNNKITFLDLVDVVGNSPHVMVDGVYQSAGTNTVIRSYSSDLSQALLSTPTVSVSKLDSLTVSNVYNDLMSCSGGTIPGTQTYVGAKDVNNNLVALSGNSVLGSTWKGFSVPDIAELRVVHCANPAIFVGTVNDSVTGYNGSRVLVLQGSNIVSAFDILNMTVDSAAVINLTNTGGHSGDYMRYFLGGRPINNASGGLILNNTYIFLDYLNTSLGLDATNPNGTVRFTTDKQVRIQTLHPNINILNFQLTWQNFSGVFDTSAGSCIGCRYDLDNGTCQAEVEKVWGMFQKYKLDIELTTATALDFKNITLYCRDANQTILAHPNCSGLFPYNYNSTGCVQWQATAGRSWLSTGPNGASGLGIDLNGTTSINITMGNITPFDGCEQIACEIYGEWEPGNTQNFVMNKTITVTAY